MMNKQHVIRNAIKLSVLGLVGIGYMTAALQTAYAGNCGGHCQAGHRCAELVKEKGAKGPEWRTEYNKCMTDPMNYK
jgi:hypothetical protein